MSDVDWGELAEAGRLGTYKPEEVVRACRQMGHLLGGRVQGKLLRHLSSVARPYLMRRVNRNMPNGGVDAVDDVLSAMSQAIVDPTAKDGAGYEAAFHTKLEQRLLDRVRQWRRDQARIEPFPTDEDTGETVEPADARTLTPEEIAMAGDLIARLPDKWRRAFLLDRAGFKMSSKGESISKMLGITPKTADDWVEKAKALLLEQMGRTQ